MVPLMTWRVKVLKSGYILKCNDFHLCAKVFVNFTMVYIFPFGKLAYIILQSNVDIISKNFPKKKETIQVFMDLGILSYNLWRVGILNHVWGSTLTVYNWICTSLMEVTTDLIVIFLRCMETSSFHFTCWNVRIQCK